MFPALHVEDQGIPVYIQIRDQMLQAIGRGLLKPGEQLPTMRQVAVALKVDLNTVRHAYTELEQTGAIVILRARGTYVADRPPPPDDAARLRKVEDMAMQVIGMARAAGIDPTELGQNLVRLAKAQRRQ